MGTNTYQNRSFTTPFPRLRPSRGAAFGVILLAALIAFEIFNFSTTEYALSDLLGNLSFLGISWAIILSIAFCGMDFAGIARLNTPQAGSGQPNETWYLFGAWLLAATMNAMLTWWGVSLALLNHESLGNSVVARETLLRVVPIFVAILVWLIRVLIIGTYSAAGTRLLTQHDRPRAGYYSTSREFAETSPSRSLGSAPVSARSSTASNRSYGATTHRSSK
jgi:hypothetical protein